ncbi:MAG: hypothetical protein WD872_02065 [Pirellulaceae bacterium]
MARLLALLCTLSVLLTSGCAMCCAPYDDHYPYAGGRWVRDNASQGRVGSAFAPAGHRLEEGISPSGEPTPAESEAFDPAVSEVTPRRDGAAYLPTQE